jgi:membrane associated rhomboid family serine protease
MILLPYAHESMSYRRMPFVTIGIVAICVLVHVVSSVTSASDEELAEATERVTSLFLEHPHLAIPEEDLTRIRASRPPIVSERIEEYRRHADRYRQDRAYVLEVMGTGEGEEEFEAGDSEAGLRMLNDSFERSGGTQGGMRRALAENMMMPVRTERDVFTHLTEIREEGEQAEQQSLDEALQALRDLKDRSPALRFGYLPAGGSLLGLFTYQFLHGGWLHLIGNLLFLWLVAFNVEDRWGRMFFPSFFLVSGAVAALCHAAMTRPEMRIMPLVGASGSISALMGVFLIHFAKTNIRVFWMHFFMLVPRWGTFAMPAYLVLPAWLFDQLLSAWLDLGSPVAYWAHIGGFAFGVATAVGLKATKIEEKHLSGKLEREEVLYESPPELVDAERFLAEGSYEAADAAVEPALRRLPDNMDALAIRIRCRLELDKAPAAADTLSAALMSAVKRGAKAQAEELWWRVKHDLERQASAIPLDPSTRVAHALKTCGLPTEAAEVYRLAIKAHGMNEKTLPAIVAYCDLIVATNGDLKIASLALSRALTIAKDDPIWSDRISAKLRAIEARAQ